jgi:hypothetical protein
MHFTFHLAKHHKLFIFYEYTPSRNSIRNSGMKNWHLRKQSSLKICLLLPVKMKISHFKIKCIIRELRVAQSFLESIYRWAVANDVIIGPSAPQCECGQWGPQVKVWSARGIIVCVRVWYYLSAIAWNLIWKISRIPRGGEDIICCGALQMLEFPSGGSPSPITIVTSFTSPILSGRAYANWLLRRAIVEAQFSSPHSEVKNTLEPCSLCDCINTSIYVIMNGGT